MSIEEIASYFAANAERIAAKLSAYEKQLKGMNELSREEWDAEFDV